MNNFKKISLHVLLLLCSCSYSFSKSQFDHSEPFQSKNIHEKYRLTPEEKCAQAGCKTTEDCLKLHLEVFKTDNKNTLQRALDADKQAFEQEQKDASNYLFWRSQEDQIKYDTATSYLTIQEKTRKFLLVEHKKYFQALEILEYYKNIPGNHSGVLRWIQRDLFPSDEYPVYTYRTRAQQDIELIEDVAISKRYPELGRHLLCHTKEIILDSLQATITEYRQEKESKTHAELAELRKKEIEEEIDKKRRIADAAEKQAQAQVDLVEQKRKENQNLSELYSLLYSINWHQLPSLSTSKIWQIKEAIEDYRKKIAHDNNQKQKAHNQLTDLIQKIDAEVDYKKSLEEAARLEMQDAQTTQDIKSINTAKSLVATMIAQQKDHERRTDREGSIPVAIPVTSSSLRVAEAHVAGSQTSSHRS